MAAARPVLRYAASENEPYQVTPMLKVLDTRELEEFAAGLADDLARRFPPAAESRTDAGAKHQIKVILEGLATRAVRYREEHKLGIYKKAKLGNVFRWKLEEHGYTKEFAERATKEIITRLAVR
ncbi:MAG TPA: hypothetical protein VMN79_09400 [Casimicrobiaceae bacterium]|nr:hypothetical protein [Casimicrobiaceae bacterium]